MSKRYYTYILSNKNDTTLYVGVTNDLERRVAEHRSGMIPGFTQLYMAGDIHGRGQVPGMNRPNASEKIEPFPWRLSFRAMLSKNAIF